MESNQAAPVDLKEALDRMHDGARADLARHLDVSPTTVARWVNQKVRPHRFFRKRIAEFVNESEETLWPM